MDKVLILSGDARLTSSLKSGLEKLHQFSVDTANTGEEAVALIDKINFSIFVTDISPPGMDALDLLSYMSLNRPNIPCIVMTDKGKPWFREKIAKQSFLYHLEKPFHLKSLVSAIMVGLNMRDEGQHFQGMTMASILPLIEILKKTCRMEARSSDNQKGYLYFNQGVLIDAHFNELRGEAAAVEISAWKHIIFKISDLPTRRTRTKVKTGLMDFAGACWGDSHVSTEPETRPANKTNKSVTNPSPGTQKKPSPTAKIPSRSGIPLSRKTDSAQTSDTQKPSDAAPEKKIPTSKKTVPLQKITKMPPTDKKSDDQVSAENGPAAAGKTQKVLPDPPSKPDNKKAEASLSEAPSPGGAPKTTGQGNMVTDMYLDYFQLAQKPFQINTDPSFLWLGEKHREALATLQYGLQENKGCLLLTGDVGVGKTTIVQAMLQSLSQNDLAVVVSHPTMEPLDFFNYIARSFGMSGQYETKGGFLKAFGDFLLTSHYKGKRVLLIIDECQLLDPLLLNEVRLFLNFEKKGTLLINVFFVGQLEFKKILLQPENRAIRQRIAVNYDIPPLSHKETEKYIEYRLAVAGTNRKIFKASAIREIYRFSKGCPRLINIIADRALLTAYINSEKQIKKGIIKECAQELDIAAINRAPEKQTRK